MGADPPSPRARSARGEARLQAFARFAGITFGLITFGSLAVGNRFHQATEILLLASAAVGAPVALLRRWPLLAWRIAYLTALFAVWVPLAVGSQPWPWHPLQLIELVLVLVAVGIRHPLRVLVWVWAFTGLLIAECTRTDVVPGLIVAATAALVLGDQIRRRREAQRGLVAQVQLSEQEMAQRALLEERTRIARELHDVVAHHMSLIAVRAETAPYRLVGQSEQNVAEFAAIAEQARLSLTEMRRLLGVLRSDAGGPELAPQPGLAEVGTLVQAAREAGAQVELRREGELSGVPEALGLTAYRIIQEALANAGRHAPGAPVHVLVSATDIEVRVVVGNAPALLPAPAATQGAVHGLVGMRERVGMLGGRLRAGPGADGGFTVEAVLPKQEPA